MTRAEIARALCGTTVKMDGDYWLIFRTTAEGALDERWAHLRPMGGGEEVVMDWYEVLHVD